MSGKAKRSRERLRMETRQQVLDRVAYWITNDSWPRGPFNTCNLDIRDYHDDKCNGKCLPLTQWEAKVAYERQLWKDEGATPQINMAELKITVLLDYLINQHNLFTRDEIDDLFNKELYNSLVSTRLNQLPELKRQQLRQQIAMSGTRPRNGAQ